MKIFSSQTFPIFLKELRPLMRSSKAFWFLMAVLTIAGLIFTVGWAGMRFSTNRPGNTASVGREIFNFLSLSQLCCLGLISPILTSTLISGERERRTLDLLRITGINSGSIVWGKLGSALAYQGLLVFCLLPILTLVFMLGGVGLDEIIFNTFMILQVIVVYGMMGLAVSSLFRKSTNAVMATVACVFILILFIPFLVQVFGEFSLFGFHSASTGRTEITNIRDLLPFITSPFFSWFQIVDQVGFIRTFGPQMGDVMLTDVRFMAHVVFQILLFICSFSVARWGLERRESIQVKQAKKIIDDDQMLQKRRNSFPYYIIDPLRRAKPIGDRWNPVFIKEKRVGALAGGTGLIRTCYVTVFLSLFVSLSILDSSINETQAVLTLGAFFLTILALPIVAGGIVSREREEGTLDLLVCTLVSPFQIVLAKFLAVMRYVVPVALSMIVLPWVFCLLVVPLTKNGYNSYYPWLIHAVATMDMGVRLVMTLTALLAFYTAVAIYQSSTNRRSIMGIFMSFFVLALLLVSPSILFRLVSILSGILAQLGEDGLLRLTGFHWNPYPWMWIFNWTQRLIEWAGCLVSPFYKFTIMHYNEPDDIARSFAWKSTVTQAAALAGMALAVLRLAGWRLKKSIGKN